ncbi:hypothetical protein BDZ31_004551 [Conexibacter arvalis]|uniref:Uncharacterized protein n=1 Tax=Conexibacter arvalis TaxID=912552 RepID=A0A840ILB8_9ACTN|nr:hypothetical protein [Conexibacter arvalis]
MLYQRPADDVAPALSTRRYFTVAHAPEPNGIMGFAELKQLFHEQHGGGPEASGSTPSAPSQLHGSAPRSRQ